MSLETFTNYDDIRAALGVSIEELDDKTLGLELYEYSLLQELEDFGSDLEADYLTVADLDVRSAPETKFYQAARLFSAYSVARQLTASLPLFSPKEISDGKAMTSRFSANPYQDTIKTVKEQYEKFKTRLNDAYAAFKSSGASTMSVRTYMAVATALNDPVTGK